MKPLIQTCLIILSLPSLALAQDKSTPLTADEIDLSGHLSKERAELIISANLLDRTKDPEKLLYTSTLNESITIDSDLIKQESRFRFDRVQGPLKKIEIGFNGDRLPEKVEGDHLQSWSIRYSDESVLLLEFHPEAKELDKVDVTVFFSSETPELPSPFEPTSWNFTYPSLATGEIKLTTAPLLTLADPNLSGLIEIPTSDDSSATQGTQKRYRFHGTNYQAAFDLTLSNVDFFRVLLSEMKVQGEHSKDSLEFQVTGFAETRNPKGASIDLLGGDAALTDYTLPEGAAIDLTNGTYQLHLSRPGKHPISYQFQAKIETFDNRNQTQFQLPPVTLFPIALSGFAFDTHVRLQGSGPVERNQEGRLRGFLPATGDVVLYWRPQEEETSSRLFFNTQAQTQIRIGTGVMRQNTTIDLRVMQGELDSLILNVVGEGEITRVTAPGLLSWDLETLDETNRQLTIRFNQAQSNSTQIAVTTVATVGDFPVQVTPLRITPQGSDRHHGSIDVINDGAVRLNVLSTEGLSRVTPAGQEIPAQQQEAAPIFPKQTFAFRHSSSEYALTVQATMIEPDIAATALMVYHLDYDQTRISADFEIEVREAPIRDFLLHLPLDYVLADVTTHQLSDFFLTPSAADNINQLRIVFNRPIIGRHQIQLRLERNTQLAGNTWQLGRIIPQATRQLRGHLGVTSIEGYRITPNASTGLTEIATVYFPKKLEGLQAAFRLTENDWSLTLNTDSIPQTVQAESFHMYTLANGIIQGSSLIHFDISGAPLDTLEFQVPNEYRNIEFTGDDVRNWSQTEDRYTVTLQSPIIGPYSILATFERSYSDSSDNLNATGITPLNTDVEQGTIVISSNRQIQLSEATATAELVRMTPEELTADHRLLVQQPVLAAYQFTQRPIALALNISTLAEANTTRQIIDRASIETRIAHDGQTVSRIRYIVKTSGVPHLQLSLPTDSRLWSATVDQQKVVPINTSSGTLIPLPPNGNNLRSVEINLASSATEPSPVRVALPTLEIPVLHSSWHMQAAPKQRLRFMTGNIAPEQQHDSRNGFAQLQNILEGRQPWDHESAIQLSLAAGLLVLGAALFRFARSSQIVSFRWRRRLSLLLASVSVLAGIMLSVVSSLQALAQIPDGSLDLTSQSTITPPTTETFVVVENRPQHLILNDFASLGWPFLLIIAAGLLGRNHLAPKHYPLLEMALWITGILGVLRWPTGGPIALLLLFAFLTRHFVVPAIQQFRQASLTNTSLTTALWFLCLSVQSTLSAATEPNALEGIPHSVEQQLRIEEDHAFGQVVLRWKAEKNESIALLRAPGLMTHIEYDAGKIRLTDTQTAPRTTRLIAQESGDHEIQFDYQIPIASNQKQPGFILPTQYGLVNRLQVTLMRANAELLVPEAVAVIQHDGPDENASYWQIVPPAKDGIRLGWQPRRRDRSEETAVYFAEWTHLLTPSSGLVEGFHDLAIRPAQGEISRISVALPDGITINEVMANDLANWRFDLDDNRVLVTLSSPQSRPFLIRILSQSVTQPLPYTTSQSFPSLDGATGQVGSIAIAAESDIQISAIEPQELVNIDPQDFQTVLLDLCRQQFPSATIRQAFRYTNPNAILKFQADEVAAHITVTTNERLSLGEDRILLATQIQARIARAGVFSLSFLLPETLNIDSITGDQLSHWSELSTDEGRLITLHLKQRWQGDLRFDLTLSGSGLTDTSDWAAPKITIQEANRQQGQLVMIPEQGIRLQPTVRDNISQRDAKSGGFKTNGALAFDLLNADWNLVFQLEQVAPWIEASSLQDVLFSEGKALVTTFLDFQIKNTAVKTFELQLPNNATNVRFEGKHFGDAVMNESAANTKQAWTVRLDRRIIGSYRLTLTYQIRVGEGTAPIAIQGAEVQNTSSHRGYLALRSQGRLQIATSQIPASLYFTDWNNIPRSLRTSLPENLAISQSFRIVDTGFDLPVSVSRNQVSAVLPAQVNDFNLTTIVSASGSTLTKATIKIVPGSKRSLAFTLPPSSQFWFARVNSQGVATSTQDAQLIVPLTQSLSEESETLVELYMQNPGSPLLGGQLETTLQSLDIDLPANSVSWTVILDPQWDFKKWSGNLELVSQKTIESEVDLDLNEFIRKEFNRQANRTREAENWLVQGNQFLNEGNDTLARNAFKNAYGLTQHDAAFNEDARVQLRSIKTQQAMAGISFQQRQSNRSAEPLQIAPDSTEQSAQQILANSDPANENTLLNLADRLIAQHEDSTQTTRGFDITLPARGTQLQFIKNVQVEASSNLQLEIQARSRSNPLYLGTAILIIAILAGSTLLRQRLTQAKA